MVSNASEDLPDPDRPVKTMSASRGRSRSTPRRLCSRAPLTIRRSANRFLFHDSIPPFDPACGPAEGSRAHVMSRYRQARYRGGMTAVDDNYTGHLEAGTAARRTLPGATIIKASVGPMDNNAYVITCSQTGQSLLIDAANDAPLLLDLVERHAPRLSLIVTSHQHPDHWVALEEVAKVTGAPTAAHRLDAEPLPVAPDRILADGDTITLGDPPLDVLSLQGP